MRVMAKRSFAAARNRNSRAVCAAKPKPRGSIDVLSETSGKVISDPAAQRRVVEEGQTLCQLDPGHKRRVFRGSRGATGEAKAPAPPRHAFPKAEARVLPKRRRGLKRHKSTPRRIPFEPGWLCQPRPALQIRKLRFQCAGRDCECEAGVKARVGSTRARRISAAEAASPRETGIDRLTITAPFAGLLESDTAELGSLMQPGCALCHGDPAGPDEGVGFVPETT